jgi:hypothetical protein
VATVKRLREIEVLAMREASLRALQKAMAEVDRGGKLAPTQHSDLDELRSGASLQVPPALLSTRSGLRSVETVNVGQWLMARMFRRLGLVP